MVYARAYRRSLRPFLIVPQPSYPPATPPYSGEDQVRRLKGG